MDTLLTRIRTVFDWKEVLADGTECFEQVSADNMPRPIKSVFLDKETFKLMGSPTQITISIEPGDTMN